MGVDGIGSGGGRPLGAVEPAEVAETRGVAKAGDSQRPSSTSSVGSAALQSLERGEISVDAYLDQRVAEATRHLEHQLSAPEMDFVREALRAELASDPVLIELVRRTVGHGPAKAG